MDNEFTFPDGIKGWFELHMEPVPGGVLILSVDITKNKEVEAEINKYRFRLEEVVAQRTAECAKVNEELTREIHEHQKMEEGFKLRAMILDNAREAIFLVNTKGDFAYANEAASKAYGYSLDEFLNMNIRSLLQPQDVPSIESLLRNIVEKVLISHEMVHVRKDNSLMSVKVHNSLVKTLHGRFIVVVVREISA
jgi:PAS domain S-box-containing protein